MRYWLSLFMIGCGTAPTQSPADVVTMNVLQDAEAYAKLVDEYAVIMRSNKGAKELPTKSLDDERVRLAEKIKSHSPDIKSPLRDSLLALVEADPKPHDCNIAFWMVTSTETHPSGERMWGAKHLKIAVPACLQTLDKMKEKELRFVSAAEALGKKAAAPYKLLRDDIEKELKAKGYEP